jgi:hypothetical protein
MYPPLLSCRSFELTLNDPTCANHAISDDVDETGMTVHLFYLHSLSLRDLKLINAQPVCLPEA